MSGKAPSDFYPQLTDARLRTIASALLDVLYDTEQELDSPLDDGYTRGTTTFGRQRNSIIRLCQSGKFEWLKLTNAGMDVTFEVGGIPCRFFADDPQNPKKPGFFRRNESDKLFPNQVGNPELMRFIVAKPQAENQDADVHFIGFDANFDEVFNWQYSLSTPVISSTDEALPKEVDIPPARAMPPANEKDQAADRLEGRQE